MLAASGMPEVLGAVRFSTIWEGQTRVSRAKLTSFDAVAALRAHRGRIVLTMDQTKLTNVQQVMSIHQG